MKRGEAVPAGRRQGILSPVVVTTENDCDKSGDKSEDEKDFWSEPTAAAARDGQRGRHEDMTERTLEAGTYVRNHRSYSQGHIERGEGVNAYP